MNKNVSITALEKEKKPAKISQQKRIRKPAWQLIVLAVSLICLLASGFILHRAHQVSTGADWKTRVEELQQVTVRIDVHHAEGKENGTGVVVDSSGLILTNWHVIRGAIKHRVPVQVGFNSGEKYVAEVVGTDLHTDVALLRITNAGQQTFSFLTPHTPDPQVGEAVATYGNPRGEGFHFTLGNVAALRVPRQTGTMNKETGDPQTTQIPALTMEINSNKGNSGGPIIDSQGRLLGILVQSDKTTEKDVKGYTYAIPSSTLAPLISLLQTNGGTVHENLGVSVRPQNYKRSGKPYTGLYVIAVHPEEVGSQLGVKEGDILITINGHAVTSVADYHAANNEIFVGEAITVEVMRESELVTLSATVPNHKE